MQKATAILEKVIEGILGVLVFLMPLFFLPITTDFYEFNKNALLIVLTCVLLLLWLVKMIVGRQVSFRHTSFDIPVLLFGLAVFVAAYFGPGNKIASLSTPLGGASYLCLTLLYFIATNNLKRINNLIYGLAAGSGVLGLITVYQFLGVGQAIGGATWIADKGWSPTGSVLISFGFLLPATALLGAYLASKLKTKLDLGAGFMGLALMLSAVGLLMTIIQLTSSKPVILPLESSWVIGIEAIKNNPLFGLGPDSYLTAFLRFRPISFNNTTFWNVRFNMASNLYLQILASYGIVGMVALAVLVWQVIKSVRNFKHLGLESKWGLLGAVILLVLFALIPSNLSIVFLFYLMLMFIGINGAKNDYAENSKILPWVLTLPVLAIMGYGLYHGGKVYSADIYYRRSLSAIAQNQGTAAYNNQILAIATNPQKSVYRTTNAQTNLALANSLAANKELSEQDRANVTTLIQQAIAEAKTAVNIEPNNAVNWEALGLIYRQLINVAQGADQWSLASYQKAVSLNPVDPSLNLNLGGIYYSLQAYDQAILWFQRAIELKPDFANAHYNLAAAYKEKKDFASALGEMEKVVALVDINSGDYQKAQTEMADLRTKLKEAQPTPAPETKIPETLTQPSPIPSPIISPPVELPEEAQPPVQPNEKATPTPAVSQTGTPAATGTPTVRP